MSKYIVILRTFAEILIRPNKMRSSEVPFEMNRRHLPPPDPFIIFVSGLLRTTENKHRFYFFA